MYSKYLIGVVACLFVCTAAFTQELLLYKEIDSTQLYLEVHRPEHMDAHKSYPAMVFYFGGGWIGGDRGHFSHHAQYFAQRGIVCFLADYRTRREHGTRPFEALKDAKSAIRYLRNNAMALGIDPHKIIAVGGSAGGHLAAATALTKYYNESSDDLSISCVPNALVLYNPVIDNGPGGYGYDRVGEQYRDFSPLHNIHAGAAPTILFLGTEDVLVPVETAKYYQTIMTKVGSRCELKLYDGQTHGFFNHNHFENYKQTVLETDEFLRSLGYLQVDPMVQIN